ncbi:MAG: hypothetical protein WCJ84_05005 [Candidatus Peregrinibacteria bacterium]
MKHEEFIKLRKEGKISAGVDNSTALKLVDHLPKKYQASHLFWSWVWMLSIPGFVLVSIFYKWWVGLLLLFFVTPMISSAIKKSAAQFVLEHAEENKKFFQFLVENDILIFKNLEKESK